MLHFTTGLHTELSRVYLANSAVLETTATRFKTKTSDFPSPADVVAYLNNLSSPPMHRLSGDLVAEHWPSIYVNHKDDLYVLREKGGLARPAYAVRVSGQDVDYTDTTACKIEAFTWDEEGGLKLFSRSKMIEWVLKRVPDNEADIKEFILWVLAGLTDRDHRTSNVRPFRNVAIRAPVGECIGKFYESGRLPGFVAALLYSRGELDAVSEAFWCHPDREKDVPDIGKDHSTRGLCQRFLLGPAEYVALQSPPADLRPEGCGEPWRYRVSFCTACGTDGYGTKFTGVTIGGLKAADRGVMRPQNLMPISM